MTTSRRVVRSKSKTAAAAPPANPPADRAQFPIVGLGASAGGLEAFETFLHHMPADSGMGFVLIQHLDPSHASVLTEILQRSTKMPVVEATDQMAVLPNRVHVIPPNRDLVIFHGALQLSVPTEPRGQRLPIDAFLRSLADDRRESAVGIILSGTGSDGALGLRAIAGAGGLCLVQDPKTAKYDGMPTSAINGGFPTQVLKVEQMPQALQAGTRPLVQGAAPATLSVAAGSGVDKILQLLRRQTGHDFALYKKSTVGRRIERRMAQHGIEDANVYARFVGAHPAEAQTLFRELLINVTQFFRDPPAFEALKAQLAAMLLADKAEDDLLRIWVAGCATGEEAYSIAIVLRELMVETQREFRVQLYSTDLDDDAIATARAGLYPPNIAQDVSPERLRRFFLKEDRGYRIKKEVRDMVVFAVQSVIKDPPFTRLDLLSCRNLLIYLEPELQDRLFPAFHYALKPGGLLFLSPSESIGPHTELFDPVERKLKIYRAKPTAASKRAVLGSGLSWTEGGASPPPPAPFVRSRETQVAELARRALLQSFAPAAVVTSVQGEIQYVHGETGRFLRPAPGHPTHNVVEMARDGLQLALREALQQAADSGLPTLNHELTVRGSDGEIQPVNLSVRLLPDLQAQQPMLLVSFEEYAPTRPSKPTRKSRAKAPARDQLVEDLQRELSQAKESMTAMLEEQQASNEELKSTNEELQSTNEELQSTNEELETSKEELQSVNEEMLTVNTELQSKVEQMAHMQDDMKNLLDNMHVGTIFLDRLLHVRSFTQDATRIYRLVGTDVGRPLADIRCELRDADLLADAQKVLDSLIPLEREVHSAGGRSYLARIQPYRTTDNVIDGVVLTFPDVTDRLRAIATAKAHAIAEAVVDAAPIPLVVLDPGAIIVSANQAYCRLFGVTPESTVRHDLFTVQDGRWDLAQVRELVQAALRPDIKQDAGAAPRMRELDIEPSGHSRLRLRVHRVVDQDGAPSLILLSIEPLDGAGSAP